jgi:hypothetical protein
VALEEGNMKVFKVFLVWFLAGLGLVVVGGVAASRIRQDTKDQEKYKAELPDATPVTLGVYTPQQLVHSKIFLYRPPGMDDPAFNYKTISQSPYLARGHGNMVTLYSIRDHFKPGHQTPEETFGALVKASDAVVRGVVTGKSSQITADDAFLFTDYTLSLMEVMKNNAEAPVETGSVITVTHPGGKVLLDGVIVRTEDQSCRPLPTDGHELVLFLKYIPESGCYQLAEYRGGFELEDRLVRALTNEGLDPGVAVDPGSFLRIIREASKR